MAINRNESLPQYEVKFQICPESLPLPGPCCDVPLPSSNVHVCFRARSPAPIAVFLFLVIYASEYLKLRESWRLSGSINPLARMVRTQPSNASNSVHSTLHTNMTLHTRDYPIGRRVRLHTRDHPMIRRVLLHTGHIDHVAYFFDRTIRLHKCQLCALRACCNTHSRSSICLPHLAILLGDEHASVLSISVYFQNHIPKAFEIITTCGLLDPWA